LNPKLTIGITGYAGLLAVVFAAYYFPWGEMNVLVVAGLGLAFAAVAWAAYPKNQPEKTETPAQPPSATHRSDATLDELRVSADLAKDLAKSSGSRDLSVDLPGVTLRLGAASASVPKRDDTPPSTESGTVEQV
jgi:hypothetical protein